jgi:hypothetical protein
MGALIVGIALFVGLPAGDRQSELVGDDVPSSNSSPRAALETEVQTESVEHSQQACETDLGAAVLQTVDDPRRDTGELGEIDLTQTELLAPRADHGGQDAAVASAVGRVGARASLQGRHPHLQLLA